MTIINTKGVKIARVSTVSFFVDTQLHNQISSTVQAGAKVTVIASEVTLERDIPGSQYVSIDIPRKINVAKDFCALVKLFILFRKEKFKIVHSTTPKAGLLCCIAGRLARVPIRLHTFTGQPWVGLKGVKYFLSKGSDKLIASLNTHCYADSISQRKFLIDSGVAHFEQVSVLGSGSLAGVDLERFSPLRFDEHDKSKLKDKLGIPLTSKVLLFVGRLSRDKGIMELLQAYQQLMTGDINVYLILLGPFEADIKVLLNEINPSIKSRIITPGFSTEPECFMAIADLLVLPSYREGFGTVVIEAAAMEVPTIGTDIYGLSDAIVDGETGLLVPVKDFNKLTSVIRLLLNNDDLRYRMGVNARRRVENEFSDARLNGLVNDEYEIFLLKSDHREAL